MDDWTQKHFAAWCDSHLRPEDDGELIQAMVTQYQADPSYYDREGWDALRRAVEVRRG